MRHRRRLDRRPAIATAVAFACLWSLVAAGLRVAYDGRVLPGTHVAGVALGGSTADEARRLVRTIQTGRRQVSVTYRGRTWTVRGGDIGLRVDEAATTARAVASGRSGPLAGFVSSVTRLLAARDVEPAYAHDRRMLDGVVRRLATVVDRPSHQGALEVDPTTLAVGVQPPRAGRALDRRATGKLIVARLQSNPRGSVRLKPQRAPVVSLAEAEAVARDARRYLSQALRVSADHAPLRVAPAQLASLLVLEPVGDSDGTRVRLGPNQRRVQRLVERLATERDRRPRDARPSAPAAPLVVEEQLDLRWRPRPAAVRVRPGRTGRRVDRRMLAARIAAAVRAQRHRTELPTDVVQPAVPTEAARRVRRLIGTFTTRMPCCEPRVTNIRLIARSVDGTIIPPGAQFSLNGVAGPRTREAGYVEAPFIADGKIVPSVGGGVSQFSTTLYNAAYFAGLRLDAHQPHSIYISRYPPGREATLDFGSIDLRWTNDTSAPVLVRAASSDTSVTVTLYGDNDDRRVNAKAGPRVALPGRDFSITVTRTIRHRDGRIVRQPFTTNYDGPPE